MQVKSIRTHNVLSPTQMTLGAYAINPYRGCEFKCSYCYAQFSDSFSTRELGIKLDAPRLLEKELTTRNISHVVIGSSCEPFTYEERMRHITENILKILNRYNVTYTILTKSPFITEYLPLIAGNEQNRIFFTFNFSDETIKHTLEDASPSLHDRLEAIEKIRKHNITVRIHIGPFIPYFSNLPELFILFKNKVKEVNIELYNNKVGNYGEIIKRLNELNKDDTKRLQSIYEDSTHYYGYVSELKKEMKSLGAHHEYTLYLIVPDFDAYYDTQIRYDEKAVF